jgi:hypothetical protein
MGQGKRAFAAFCAFVVGWGIAAFPYKDVRAAAPLIFAAPVVLEAVLTTGGTWVVPVASAAGGTISTWASGAAVTAGAAISYFAWKGKDGNQLRVPTGSSGANTVPSPDAPMTTQQQTLYDYTRQGYHSGYGPSPAAQCAAAASVYNSDCPLANCANKPYSFNRIENGDQCYLNQVSSGVSFVGSFEVLNTQQGCAAGYNLVSGTCVLQNARLVTSDGKVDVKRVGNTYEHEQDVDKVPDGRVTGSINGDTISVAGFDSYGNPVQFKVQATPGGSILTAQTQVTASNGDTMVKTQTLNMDQSGVIQGNAQATTTGTVTPSSTTQTATVTTGTTAAPTSVEFPQDYAKEDTQQKVLEEAKKTKEALTKTDEDPPAAQTPKNTSDFEGQRGSNPFSNYLTPTHSSACPTIALDGTAFSAGWSWTVDGHCPLFEQFRAQASQWMVVVWMIIAAFIVLGA